MPGAADCGERAGAHMYCMSVFLFQYTMVVMTYLATVDVLDGRLSEEEVHMVTVLHGAHETRS